MQDFRNPKMYAAESYCLAPSELVDYEAIVFACEPCTSQVIKDLFMVEIEQQITLFSGGLLKHPSDIQ